MSECAFLPKLTASQRSGTTPPTSVEPIQRSTPVLRQHILMLQRLVGNQAVLRMLRSGTIARHTIQRTHETDNNNNSDNNNNNSQDLREELQFALELDQQYPTPLGQIPLPMSVVQGDHDQIDGHDYQTIETTERPWYGLTPPRDLTTTSATNNTASPATEQQDMSGMYGESTPTNPTQTHPTNTTTEQSDMSGITMYSESAPTNPTQPDSVQPDSAAPNVAAPPNAALPPPIMNNAVRKYKELKYRHIDYIHEKDNSRHPVETLLKNIKIEIDAKASQGIFISFPQWAKQELGWSDEEMQKYIHNQALRDDVTTQVEYYGEDRAAERQQFEVQLGGSLMQGSPPRAFDTANKYSKFSGAGFAIYVMSQDGKFYSDSHRVGLFHHSSFLGGGAVAGAGGPRPHQELLRQQYQRWHE